MVDDVNLIRLSIICLITGLCLTRMINVLGEGDHNNDEEDTVDQDEMGMMVVNAVKNLR